MKSAIWFLIGIIGGFAIAHQVNRTAPGRHFFGELDSKAREFGAAVSDGYRQRESELRDALGDIAD